MHSHQRNDLPAVLVTGVDGDAMAAVTIGLQWDLPTAVVVQHRIDVEAGQLHRTVSDVTGVLERDVIDLAHACVSCAIREDVVPTLVRLASLDRWQAVVAHLPVSASASQVCRVLALEDDPGVAVAGVVAAVDGPSAVETFTSDVLLAEIDRHASADDRRGLAETAGGIVEYADVVAVSGDCPAEATGLLRALAPPAAQVGIAASAIDAAALLAGVHDHARTEAWSHEVVRAELPPLQGDDVWRLDLRADRPLHPERLHAAIPLIGDGPYRSRGCVWLPTRAGEVAGWDGAGGQVSLGSIGSWGAEPPMTRLVLTGLASLTTPAERAATRAAFEDALLTDAELALRGTAWTARSDGFEPWLGPIRAVA